MLGVIDAVKDEDAVIEAVSDAVAEDVGVKLPVAEALALADAV